MTVRKTVPLYRTIDASFWTDPKVRKLSTHGKALLLYLITNPHTHVSGIYYLPRSIAVHETGLNAHQLDTLSNTLSSAGFCKFDPETETVWVKNMMKYQGSGDKNVRSAAHHITKDLHKSRLIPEFLAHYPEIKALVPDTLSMGYPEKSVDATPDSRSPNTEHREQNTDSPPSAFERFWREYPRKIGKGDAEKSWNRQKLTPMIEMILAALELQRSGFDWDRENGRFIPHPSTWLNRKGWLDEVRKPNGNGNGLHFEHTQDQIDAEMDKLRKMGVLRK